jgi:hypothetical protein
MTRKSSVFGLSVALPASVAWLVGVFAAPLSSLVPWTDVYSPSLPRVSVPDGRAGDFASTVPALFMALVVGVFCLLLVEVAKYGVFRLNSGRAYVLLVGYQMALFVEILRAHAPDWWTWMLSWLGLIDLHKVSEETRLLPIPPLSISLALVAAALILGYRDVRFVHPVQRQGD